MIRIVAGILVALVSGLVTVSAQNTELDEDSLVHDGIERTYLLYAPASITGPAPLVLVLHPAGGTGAYMADMTSFRSLADEEGFIAVYPDGIDGGWNYVRDIPGYASPVDDTGFLTELVNEVAEVYPVDLTRVYAAGFSNGGFMAQRLACEAPETFAAFATVAAGGFGGMPQVCPEPGSASAPMLIIHGTDDAVVPWEGLGQTRGNRTVYITYPLPETLAFWAGFNECGSETETADLPRRGESLVRVIRVECPDDAEVVLYAVLGGGHNWPGSAMDYELAGEINQDIDAAREIWAFFEPHRRTAAEEAGEVSLDRLPWIA